MGVEPRVEVTERLDHFPALDGLRGLAIFAVVAYHMGVQPDGGPMRGAVPGGFLGVDLFFVLSGFLITSLLVIDDAQRGSTVSAGFWMRRVRRLLPPVLVLLGLLVAHAAIAGKPWEMEGLRHQGVATLLYAQNWYLILGNPGLGSIRHTWSLSVEEQWYLFWPLALAALLILARRSRLVVAAAMLVLATVSLGWMAYLADTGKYLHAYTGTDTRASQLLIGAALGVLLLGVRIESRTGRLVLEGLGIVSGAALVVMACTTTFKDDRLYHGGFGLVAILAAVVVAASVQRTSPILRPVLSWAPLAGLGLISYGVYLYHIPLIEWVSFESTGVSGGLLFVLRVGVILGVAIASYLLVERPLRRIKATPRATLAYVPVALAMILLLVVVTAGGRPQSSAEASGSFAGRVADTTPASARRLLVVGDYRVRGLADATGIYGAHRLRGLPLSFYTCDLLAGDLVLGSATIPHRGCGDWPGILRSVTEKFRPDATVLVLGAQAVFDRREGANRMAAGSPQLAAELQRGLEGVRHSVSGSGHPILLLGVPCTVPERGQTSSWDAVRQDPVRRAWVNSVWRDFAAAHRATVTYVDAESVLCPDGNPNPTVAGASLRNPDGQLSPVGIRFFWDWLDREAARVEGRNA